MIIINSLHTINAIWTFGRVRAEPVVSLNLFSVVSNTTMFGVQFISAVALYGLLAVVNVSQAFKTVCYYDGKALWRKGNRIVKRVTGLRIILLCKSFYKTFESQTMVNM